MAAQSTLRPTKHIFLTVSQRYLQFILSRWKLTSNATRLAATLALTIAIISSAYGGQCWLRERSEDDARGQRLLRRNSGLRGKDGSRTIFVPYRSSTAKVIIHPTKPMTFDAHRRLFLNPPRATRLGDGNLLSQVPPPNTRPGLNIAFIHQFLSLLSIMVPHWNSKESGLIVSQGAFLLLRTYLSLVVTRLDGEVVRDLVSGNGKGFLWGKGLPSPSIPPSRNYRSFSICHNQNQTQLFSSPQFNLGLNSSIFPKYHLSDSQPYSSSSTTPAPAASHTSSSSDSGSELSIEEYHSLSNSYIDTLVAILEQLQEERADVDCEYSAGVLTLYFPPHGTYVLNKQPPNKQIWLSSPVSGPKRYDYVKIKGGRGGDWVYARDGSRLSELLERELGVDVGVVEEGGW